MSEKLFHTGELTMCLNLINLKLILVIDQFCPHRSLFKSSSLVNSPHRFLFGETTYCLLRAKKEDRREAQHSSGRHISPVLPVPPLGWRFDMTAYPMATDYDDIPSDILVCYLSSCCCVEKYSWCCRSQSCAMPTQTKPCQIGQMFIQFIPQQSALYVKCSASCVRIIQEITCWNSIKGGWNSLSLSLAAHNSY